MRLRELCARLKVYYLPLPAVETLPLQAAQEPGTIHEITKRHDNSPLFESFPVLSLIVLFFWRMGHPFFSSLLGDRDRKWPEGKCEDDKGKNADPDSFGSQWFHLLGSWMANP